MTVSKKTTVPIFQATSGSGIFVVPPNVYKIFVSMVGGGGGGSSSTAGGGGGGGYVDYPLGVSPFQEIAYAVGAAGVDSNTSGATAGGSTTFETLTAGGGSPATGSTTAGAGGTAAGGISGENGTYNAGGNALHAASALRVGLASMKHTGCGSPNYLGTPTASAGGIFVTARR